MKNISFFLVIFSLFLGSCLGSEKIDSNPQNEKNPQEAFSLGDFTYTQGDDVYRIEDKEAGVICYIFYPQAYSGGISCLPKEETLLP